MLGSGKSTSRALKAHFKLKDPLNFASISMLLLTKNYLTCFNQWRKSLDLELIHRKLKGKHNN